MNDPSVKSSWICYRKPAEQAAEPGQGAPGHGSSQSLGGFRRSAAKPLLIGLFAWLLCLALSGPSVALKKPVELEDIFNPLLGPEYSHWLVGPIYEMASADEVKTYLDLVSDEEAQAFIVTFWQERNKGTAVFQDTPQDIFEQRVEEANKRYTENAFPGERTDRGTIYILYGEPESVSYESPRKVGDRTVEVWSYGKKAEPGLDGHRPKKSFRFVEIDGSTVFFTGQAQNPRDRVRRRNTQF